MIVEVLEYLAQFNQNAAIPGRPVSGILLDILAGLDCFSIPRRVSWVVHGHGSVSAVELFVALSSAPSSALTAAVCLPDRLAAAPQSNELLP